MAANVKGPPLVTAGASGLGSFEQNIQPDSTNQIAQQIEPAHALRAELTGSACTALGIVAHGHAPVFALCRKLVAAGVDPGRPLCAYRGDMLSIAIRSIREGAALTVDEHNGTRFAKWKAFPRSAVEPGIARHEEAAPTQVGTREQGARPGAERRGDTPP